jgi:hypothetical protein
MGFNGPLRIPLSEIEAYSRLRALDFSQRQDFLFYVERLDNVWMTHIQKLRDEEDQKNKRKQNTPGRARR